MASKKVDFRGAFLTELTEGVVKWRAAAVDASDKDAEECIAYAEAYERLLCVFTTPKPKGKEA